jgi:glycosyltransferase involved in cell wall biosynthesis
MAPTSGLSAVPLDLTHPHPQPSRRSGVPTPGVTAVLRVRNEAHSLPWSLPQLLRATDEVLLVDNRSTDGTPVIAVEIAERLGLADKLRVADYPYRLSRCGPEHLDTPPESAHSLVRYNNWAESLVHTSYVVKWDGDMALTRDGERALSAFGWQVQHRRINLRLPRHPLYVESDRVAYLDLAMRNREHFGHPVLPGFSYAKAFEWEFLLYPEGTPHHNMPEGSCVELKHLDDDEFGHWTDPDAFLTSARTQRKRREYMTFDTIRSGDWQQIPGLHRIEAPEGVHVIEHVVQTWLPKASRPLDPSSGA